MVPFVAMANNEGNEAPDARAVAGAPAAAQPQSQSQSQSQAQAAANQFAPMANNEGNEAGRASGVQMEGAAAGPAQAPAAASAAADAMRAEMGGVPYGEPHGEAYGDEPESDSAVLNAFGRVGYAAAAGTASGTAWAAKKAWEAMWGPQTSNLGMRFTAPPPPKSTLDGRSNVAPSQASDAFAKAMEAAKDQHSRGYVLENHQGIALPMNPDKYDFHTELPAINAALDTLVRRMLAGASPTMSVDECVVQPANAAKALKPNQWSVFFTMQWFVQRYLKNMPIPKGFWVWHNPGAGKSLIGACCLTAWLNTDRYVFIVGKERVSRRLEAIVRSNVKDYLAPFLRFSPNASKRFGSVRNHIIGTNFSWLGDRVLQHRSGVHAPVMEAMQRGVFVIDEFQDIFEPPAQYAAGYRAFLEWAQSPESDGAMFVLLTATPGKSIRQLIDMIRVLTPSSWHPMIRPGVKPSALSVMVRGCVSYYDRSGDTGAFPRLKEVNVHVPFGPEQYMGWAQTAVDQMAFDTGQFDSMPEDIRRVNYLFAARRLSNSITDVPKDLVDAYQNQAPTVVDLRKRLAPQALNAHMAKLRQISLKFSSAITDLEWNSHVKHFVYFHFSQRQGVDQFRKLLFARGWVDVSAWALAMARQLRARKATQLSPADLRTLPGEPHRRFLTPRLTTSTSTGEIEDEMIISIFNDPMNDTGLVAVAMLATAGFFQAIDLSGVQRLHLIDPFIYKADDRQFVGRAHRFRSHCRLPKQQREVTVLRYFTDVPPKIQALSQEAERLRDTFLSVRLKQMEVGEEIAAILRGTPAEGMSLATLAVPLSGGQIECSCGASSTEAAASGAGAEAAASASLEGGSVGCSCGASELQGGGWTSNVPFLHLLGPDALGMIETATAKALEPDVAANMYKARESGLLSAAPFQPAPLPAVFGGPQQNPDARPSLPVSVLSTVKQEVIGNALDDILGAREVMQSLEPTADEQSYIVPQLMSIMASAPGLAEDQKTRLQYLLAKYQKTRVVLKQLRDAIEKLRPVAVVKLEDPADLLRVIGPTEGTDLIIAKEAERRAKVMEEATDAIKTVAIDCAVFKDMHKVKCAI